MPRPGLAAIVELGADQHRAFAHAADSVEPTAARPGDRPQPSSRTVSTVRASVLIEPQLDSGRLGVSGDVRQRLLRDAIDDELRILR